ncbi:tetratricopeptide repeat protein [Sutcliffiella sp. NPDC057660]|uniref:tetratricopeptide repeat protein n=1 Tax=Sutcliffiella sp. NPDC057660 TaxID=3346199 RepID=UPI0036B58C97
MRNGEMIDYYRNKKGISQENLSQGIFPASHLLDLVDKLLSCYESTVRQDPKESWKKLSYINEEYNIGSQTMPHETLLLYLCVKLKYALLIFDKKLIDSLYNQISDLPTSKNTIIEYIRKKTIGIYYYRVNDNLQSIFILKQALEMHNKLPLSEEDKAELFYQIALTSQKTSDYFEAITYAEKALSIYQSLYYNRRSAECHVILGLSYHKVHQLEKAQENYLYAKKIGVDLKDVYLESMALHNLGCMQSFLGNSEDAIFYFLESLKLKKEEDRSLFSINTLVKEYYKLNQNEFALGWAEEGLVLAQRNKIEEYIIHFNVHIYLITKNPEIEKYISDYVIDYFTRAGDKDNVAKYAEILAEYYTSTDRYQSACEYYELSLKVWKNKTTLI